jgi:hypothetical protein
MWTKWGLNPRPHATELLSQELAKQARYHCAIRPYDSISLSKNRSVFPWFEGVTRLRHQEFAAHLLTVCRPGVTFCSYTKAISLIALTGDSNRVEYQA